MSWRQWRKSCIGGGGGGCQVRAMTVEIDHGIVRHGGSADNVMKSQVK